MAVLAPAYRDIKAGHDRAPDNLFLELASVD
jgi:hypothetical protein